ncbi:MAG: SLC13 family permease [Oscillospiraceae bacterium]|jgi:sodium-dependent dicarboxylate transporter 2/3/5|nr:Arsenical pump membrane protein [Ruminococcaceae bacterium BL-4]
MSQPIIALIILAITIVLFIWEPVPIVVTAIGASIAFAYTGIIKVSDIFTGYNSTTIILLAGMMVLGSSLFHTGITDVIGEKMVKITGKNERNIILATLIVSFLISGVCSNIGVMVAMAPLVTAMCISAGVGPSRSLLALLFGAQFGGFLTLVGVGSNASAASVMSEMGYKPFGFFTITPFGIGVCILGTLYFTFIGSKLIPDTGYIPEFADTEKKTLDKKKAMIAGITMLCVLVVIAMNPKNVPMHVAAVVGALVVVGTKCMSVKDAIHAIDWNCLILVGSLTAISTGVQNSGAGDAMAKMILNILGDHPSTFMITTVIFFAAALLTQVMSNIPTILLFLPIGFSIAQAINVSPYAVAMVITLAGAASYATPFAAPQNMMTVGWTHYKFSDFIKIGIPMVLITYLVVVIAIPIFMPY